MTFDEANDIVVFAKDGTEIMMRSEQESWNDEGSRNATLKLIDELRKTYAPTIEMTQSQKNSFDEAKRALHTRDLSSNFCQEWTALDEVSGNIFGHGPGEATDEQINMIMRAWLHPELVKVVD